MRAVREVVSSIAAGLACVALCGAGTAVHADAPPSPEPLALAHAAASYDDRAAAAPHPLMAHTIVPATPVAAMHPVAPAAVVVAQSGIVRTVTPNGSQPGVLWVLAIGAVLCRIGARVVRAS